jgi:hypothetical protein
MSDIGLSQGDLDHDGLYGNLSSKTSTSITSLGQTRGSSPNLSLRRSTTNSIVISGHDFAHSPLSLLEKASLLLCSLLCYMARCSIALVCRGWKYCWPPGIIGLVLLYTLYRTPKFSKLLGLLTCCSVDKNNLLSTVLYLHLCPSHLALIPHMSSSWKV